MKRQKMPESKIKLEESKNTTKKEINYAEIVFDETGNAGKSVIRGAEDKCVYTQVHPVSLPEHKSPKCPPDPPVYMNKLEGKLRKPPLAYESVTVECGSTAKSPQYDIYEVLEGHKCASMSEERLIVKLGDFVQAEKTEATRALCVLVDKPDSPRGWIPIEKLKLVYTNATDLGTSKPSPVPAKVPTVPPKSPDLVQNTSVTSSIQKTGYIGVMSRVECEKMFQEKPEEGSFVIRESTHRVGDYTLSVYHGGRLHHFPIKYTEDKKYLIGGYKFKHLSRVVSYYQENPVFYDGNNEAVLLHEPLIPTKIKKPVIPN